MQRIQPGSKVVLHFKISLLDGSEVMASETDAPLSLQIGQNELPAGLEMALWGMTAGESQRIHLRADQAWGLRNPQMIHRLPQSSFDHPDALEVGTVMVFHGPNGEEMPGTILRREDEWVEVDFNHPLAGEDIIFWCEILEVDNSLLPEDEAP